MRRLSSERWAQIGIVALFLALIRTLSEFFRLKYIHGPAFSVAIAAPFVTGALIAAVSCSIAVVLFFFRRHRTSAVVSVAAIVILFVYKIAVLGW